MEDWCDTEKAKRKALADSEKAKVLANNNFQRTMTIYEQEKGKQGVREKIYKHLDKLKQINACKKQKENLEHAWEKAQNDLHCKHGINHVIITKMQQYKNS